MTKHAWGFHPAARAELIAAAERYEKIRTGLGDALLDAVVQKLAFAARTVTPGTAVPGVADENVRRVFLSPRFPYQLVLVVDVDIVLAVAHLRRHPDYWRTARGLVRQRSERHTSPRRSHHARDDAHADGRGWPHFLAPSPVPCTTRPNPVVPAGATTHAEVVADVKSAISAHPGATSKFPRSEEIADTATTKAPEGAGSTQSRVCENPR